MTRTFRSIITDVRALAVWQVLVIFVAGVMSATVAIWFTDRQPPVIVLSATAEEQIVQPGGMLKVRYELDRYRSCAVKLDRLIFDAQRVRYTLQDDEFAAAPGVMGRDSFTSPIPIPRMIVQGKATYVVISRYQCNLLQNWWPIVTRTEVPFEVRGPAVPTDTLPIEVLPIR